jgi:uncharacterized tellurite resistance protein B-like protein
MPWNQLADDMPRAQALAEILSGAALSDGHFADEERMVVGGMMMKVLGVSALPLEIEAHLASFDPHTFSLVDAVGRLALGADRDRKALVKVVVDILCADAVLEGDERVYVDQLAALLGMGPSEVDALLG